MATQGAAWGFVTAHPHEYLIQVRGGRVIRQQQGGSCFKWPGDTVALVDTSVHRLQFQADQVTREKTGVAVTGLAVFRVVEPLLAWRMLNLADKGCYIDILREMFVGATRRLVANLTLEECMTRRKDALAAELMAEIAPVVSGRGRQGDSTDRGWGVAVDTIEVQDVRVLSQEVFDNLQAPYRQSLALEALRAREQVERAEDQMAAEQERRREAARRELMALEEARLAAERERGRQAAEHAEALRELEAQAATARAEAEAVARVRIAQQEAEATRILGEARATVVRLERAAHDSISAERLQELVVTQTLPQVAGAFRDSYDHVVINGGDMGFLGQGLGQVLATLEAFGVSLPRREP